MKSTASEVRLGSMTTDSEWSGSIMYSIHQLYFSIQKRLENALSEKSGISFSQFMIMAGFSCRDGEKITQAKLAENLALTEATISRHINALVLKKLLTKEKEAHNKKSFKLSLTSDGITSYTKAKKLIMKELDMYFSLITAIDQKRIAKNLKDVVTLLQQKK